MKKILYIVAGLALVISSSCKKLIDIPETNLIDEEKALVNVTDNEAALIGAYSGFGVEMAIKLNGCVSDELKPGDFYVSATLHEWQFGPTDIIIRDNYIATTAYYYTINRINRILKALPKARAVNSTDEALRTKVEGEAKFLRAYSHFELFRYYCGNYTPSGLAMPYMEEVTLNTFPRIGMQEYFNKLEKDLTDAGQLLSNVGLSDKFRTNKYAVLGLKARVALYKKEWDNAIAASTEYINILPLASKTDFPKIWTDEISNEIAFKIKRTSRMGSFYRGVFTKNAAGVILPPSSVSWVPTNKLWDQYDQTNDVRFNAYFISEPLLQAANKPYKILKKYAGGPYASSTENLADEKIFRTGEMYLIRAEALAEKGNITGANSAESDLNTLREARITNYTSVVLTSKENAITEILNEKYKELALEGHRFWDLKRRGLAVERLAADAPTATAVTLPANNFRFVLPIPLTEINANPKMTQNPGYE